jgi:hypothetical protein
MYSYASDSDSLSSKKITFITSTSVATRKDISSKHLYNLICSSITVVQGVADCLALYRRTT